MSLQEWLTNALEALEGAHRRRKLNALRPSGTNRVVLNGRELLLFSSNDYLGLSTHPHVKEAIATAARESGSGPRGSALVCGYTELHAELERDLATLKHMETALLFPTGYQANMAVLSALGTSDTVVFSDALNHASIIDGCRLSKARVEIYAHRDMDDLERRIQAAPETRRIVVTDEIFSMDGVGAPMAELKRLKEAYDFILVTDSAHSTLVYGPTGGGWSEACGVPGVADFTIGTLSKAIGCQGGFVACSEQGREWLLNHGRSFIFTTALALPLVAAARAAIEVSHSGTYRERLWANAQQLATALGEDTPSPIVPVILGTEKKALAASASLLEKGLHVPAIRPPTVPEGACRLRVALSASHTAEEVGELGIQLNLWSNHVQGT